MNPPDPMPEDEISNLPSDSPDAPRNGESPFSRRALFRAGGALSLGLAIAACGQRGGSSAPGRVGNAPPIATLPTDKMEVNDAVLLRTLASLEYTTLDVFDRARELAGNNVAPKHQDAFDLFDRFISDHRANADALNSLATQAGGEPFECPNPWYGARIIPPVMQAIAGGGPDDLPKSDDPQRDSIVAIWGLEQLLGASAHQFVTIFEDPTLRAQTMSIGFSAVRRSAALAIAATGSPAGYASPQVFGDATESDSDTVAVTTPHAIVSQFGLLSGVPFTIGAEAEGGIRQSLSLTTPAENSYVYGYVGCA